MGRRIPEVEEELEARVDDLGYELVDVVWAGSSRRPILRIRIDRPGSTPGQGVTVDDCAVVSRALEPWLDAMDAVPERYVLEVSSPGVDRPLTRPAHWARFAGEEVAIRGHGVLAGRGKRLEGTVVALEEVDGGESVRVRLPDGEEVRIPLDQVADAHLIYRWE